METETQNRTVAPLTRTTRTGEVLRRPAEIEAEIAMTLTLPHPEIRQRAVDSTSERRMSSECMVHLIRRDLRGGGRSLAEELTPLLLARCEANLVGSVRGFPPATSAEIREEILGGLAISLLEPGDVADFLEVRFALALKRLRIDACRKQRRRDSGRVVLSEAGASAEPAARPLEEQLPEPPRQEDRLLLRQALASLSHQEREVLVLHRLAGMPLTTQASANTDLVRLLGFSERTLRNRLRAAEAKLEAFRECAS